MKSFIKVYYFKMKRSSVAFIFLLWLFVTSLTLEILVEGLTTSNLDEFSPYFTTSLHNNQQGGPEVPNNNDNRKYEKFTNTDAVSPNPLSTNNNKESRFKPIIEAPQTFDYHQQKSLNDERGRIQELVQNYQRFIQPASAFLRAQQENHHLQQLLIPESQQSSNNQPLRQATISSRVDNAEGRSSWDSNNVVVADSNERCQRKSLGKLLQRAKNMLTDGFTTLERSATAGNLMMLGSSVLAAAIPLAVYVLPDYSKTGVDGKRAGGKSNIEMTSSGSSSSPLSGGLQSRVESIMGWIERSIEHLPNFPRLHPQECVKRSICEAHNDPEKYGAIGFLLRLFFPATNLSVTDRMDNMEFKVINKYRHAAGYGLNKRLDNNGTSTAGVCKQKYEDCLVSLLDVSQNLMDIFLK